jgi:hypothetical protein
MELADDREISQLLAAAPRRAVRTWRRKNAVPETYQGPLHMSRRCNCSKCATCLDNARWDRIFAEKFADSSYYADLSLRRGSPLQSL